MRCSNFFIFNGSVIRCCFMLLLLLPLSSHSKGNFTASYATLNGAACFISDTQKRILMIQEIISQKLALPGGNINFNETPQQAAERETYEETGLVVKAGEELYRTTTTVIYSCQATEKIQAHDLNYRLALLPAWQAPYFGKEVAAILLVKPSFDILLNSRFPDQAREYFHFLDRNPPSVRVHYEDFTDLVTEGLQKNATLSLKLHEAIQSLPSSMDAGFSGMLTASHWLGSIQMLFVLLPVAIAIKGIKRGVQLIFVVITTVSISVLLQMALVIPQPRQLFPELILSQKIAFDTFWKFGCSLAFAVWGIICYWYRGLGKSSIYICLFPYSLAALSGVYFGYYYLLEVLLSAVIGISTVFLAVLFYAKAWLFKPSYWLNFAAMFILLAFNFAQPVFIYFGVFAFVYAMILLQYGQLEIDLSYAINARALWSSLLMMPLIWVVCDKMTLISSSKALILAGQSIGILLLTLWLTLMTPKIAS